MRLGWGLLVLAGALGCVWFGLVRGVRPHDPSVLTTEYLVGLSESGEGEVTLAADGKM